MSNIKETIKEELKEVEVPMIIDENNIKEFIYEIRGKKVMLDFDLARIYGYSTRAFNQQIKNNLVKFEGDDFMFQLTNKERTLILMSKNLTSSWGGTRKLPYAFTEQGVYMLMTVLRGPLAIKQTRALIRVFKELKDYAIETAGLLMNTNPYIESKFSNYDKRLDDMEGKIGLIMDNFNDPDSFKELLILDGERIEADLAFQTIYSLAKESIILVDDYIGLKTMKLFKGCKPNIKIIICSDNVARDKIDEDTLNDFKEEMGFEVRLIPTNNRVHDRYIIIDYKTDTERIFHCGGSSKDMGGKIATMMEIEKPEVYHPVIDRLLE